ncbi:MFS transporter [Streptomyces sp. WMMB 322]|uniref:MFS transporter n=1 Tax=Streptomyces sp. WMMB 322 TaxID=1286821 RepID=UPI0006E1F6F2|nr:MFS transporter [Streptomyces sp. WMMB 322]SCK52368.1 Predicted arabinose efflux permease, MFS family [Streptomyces sp. WMMB 322]
MTRSPSGRRSLRPLAGVLAATGLSLTGTRISVIALPWFVLVTTGSASQTGLVAFCELGPYVLVKAFIGPLVDRSGPRIVSWSTDLVSATAAVTIPALHAADLLSFWLLLLLVAVIGAARAPGDLAKQVMVPEAADLGSVRLERATGLSGVMERLAFTLGPAAGGTLVALLGPMTALVANAACFAMGSLVIALVVPRGVGRTAEARDPDAEGPGYWRRLGEGMRFLRNDPLLLTITAMIAVTNLLDTAFSSVLVPVWAKESGNGPAAIGLTGTAWGLSAIVASFTAAAVAHRLNRRVVFFAGFVLAGAPRFLILALDVPLWTVVAVFIVSGFGAGFLNPILGAVIYERIPRELLGRVTGLGTSMAWLGMPLGGLVAGAAVASVGLVPSLAVAGAAYFLTTNLTGLRPEWRQMDRRRAEERDLPDEQIPQRSDTAPT